MVGSKTVGGRRKSGFGKNWPLNGIVKLLLVLGAPCELGEP